MKPRPKWHSYFKWIVLFDIDDPMAAFEDKDDAKAFAHLCGGVVLSIEEWKKGYDQIAATYGQSDA